LIISKQTRPPLDVQYTWPNGAVAAHDGVISANDVITWNN
jgi:hypothetical protein